MPRTVRRYSLHGFAGLVEQRRVRSSGHLVGLYHAGQAGFDECVSDADPNGLPWATVCEEHGTIVNHATLELARGHLSQPEYWCEDCAGEIGDGPQKE